MHDGDQRRRRDLTPRFCLFPKRTVPCEHSATAVAVPRGSRRLVAALTHSAYAPQMTSTDLGDAPTSDQARAFRPRLDDPTRLENGHVHPVYVEWMLGHTYADSNPFTEFLHAHADHLVDDRDYFDKKRVIKALGPSGPKMFVPHGPLPTAKRIPALAELLGVPTAELTAVVECEKAVRREYESMLGRCSWLPYKLLTWEQTVAGVPCPGCGRAWLAPRNEADDAAFTAEHRECDAGGNSLAEGPLHCMRCCGFPAVNPEILERVRRLMEESTRRRQEQAAETPEDRATRAAAKIAKRTKRIAQLEAELAKLRAEAD